MDIKKKLKDNIFTEDMKMYYDDKELELITGIIDNMAELISHKNSKRVGAPAEDYVKYMPSFIRTLIMAIDFYIEKPKTFFNTNRKIDDGDEDKPWL